MRIQDFHILEMPPIFEVSWWSPRVYFTRNSVITPNQLQMFDILFWNCNKDTSKKDAKAAKLVTPMCVETIYRNVNICSILITFSAFKIKNDVMKTKMWSAKRYRRESLEKTSVLILAIFDSSWDGYQTAAWSAFSISTKCFECLWPRDPWSTSHPSSHRGLSP